MMIYNAENGKPFSLPFFILVKFDMNLSFLFLFVFINESVYFLNGVKKLAQGCVVIKGIYDVSYKL